MVGVDRMIIAVSGTHGTGKSEVARALAAMLKYAYIDVNEFAGRAGLIKGVDRARGAKIVDTDGLGRVEFPENSVLDSHVAHFAKADVYVVLRTNPEVLRLRLEKKKWDKRKITENVEAELIGVCSVEARELWENVLDIDTSRLTPQKTAKIVRNLLARNSLRNDAIDWLAAGYEPELTSKRLYGPGGPGRRRRL